MSKKSAVLFIILGVVAFAPNSFAQYTQRAPSGYYDTTIGVELDPAEQDILLENDPMPGLQNPEDTLENDPMPGYQMNNPMPGRTLMNNPMPGSYYKMNNPMPGTPLMNNPMPGKGLNYRY